MMSIFIAAKPMEFIDLNHSGWSFFATHLKNMLVKLDHFPWDRGEHLKKMKPH